jgi:cytochrome c oxidase subunit 3
MVTTETKRAAIEKPVDYTGAKMGMWLFLFTELLFFGGLFLLYAVYRSQFLQAFHSTSGDLSVTLGAINTIILITSSLTMALSITAMKKAKKKLSCYLQLITILLGAAFLIVKYFEWDSKISQGMFPGSPVLAGLQQGKIIFYNLYFVMTGLHGLHVLAGLVAIGIICHMSARDRINADDFVRLENVGLYWHLVDVVWVYLFPLLYLVR